MIRLAISVEGRTEEEFCKGVLTSHLRLHGVEMQPIILGRGREGSASGGNVSIERLAAEMALLCHGFNAVTSLVDFYGFRGKKSNSVESLEVLVGKEIERKGIDWNGKRILPYIQRHEFEGLLFSDVSAFSVLTDAPQNSVFKLGKIRSRFPTPEDINDNKNTTPSKRVMKIIPRYRKPLHGPWVAREIGLDAIRNECPRFHAWISSLEALGELT